MQREKTGMEQEPSELIDRYATVYNFLIFMGKKLHDKSDFLFAF
jgi:hypothetical protein